MSSAFGDLRAGKEFTDVTLACEDGQQVEKVDKVVLTLSSPFFLPYSGFSLSQAKAPLQSKVQEKLVSITVENLRKETARTEVI